MEFLTRQEIKRTYCGSINVLKYGLLTLMFTELTTTGHLSCIVRVDHCRTKI